MAQGYDADVQLSVGLSLDDIIDQSNKITKEVSKIFDSVDSSKLTKGMKKMQATMSKTESQMSSIISDIEASSAKMAGAARFDELGKDAQETAIKVQELDAQIKSLQKGKKDTGTLVQIKALEDEMNALIAHGDEVVAEMIEIKRAGNDVFTDQDAARAIEYALKLGDTLNAQRLNIEAFKEMEDQQKREAEAAAEAARLEQEHAEALQRIRDSAGQINPEIEGTVNRLKELNDESQQIAARLEELAEAEIGTGYEEYDQLVARQKQIAEERKQANEEIAHYNQEQLEALNSQQTEEERLRELEEERAAAQERAVAIIRGELNPEVAEMVDRYNEVGEQIRTLEDDLKRMAEEGHGIGYADYDNTVRQISQLRHKYGELRQGIDEYAQSLSYEAQERERLEAETQQRISTAQVENQHMAELTRTYNDLGKQLEEMTKKQEELRSQGLGAGYKEYDELTQSIARAQQQYDRINTEMERYSRTVENSANNTNGLKNALKNIGGILAGTVRRGLSLAVNGISNLISRLKQGTQAATSFAMSSAQMVKNLVVAGLGVAGLTSLFSSLKGAITEGINNLAQFNSGSNSTNAALTQLTSSLAYLKNAWGAAFAPILSYVAPALSRLISMIASAVNAIAHLFAALGGKGTVTVAKYKETDYAASQSKSGSGGSKGKSAQEKYEEAQKKAQEKYEKKLADTQEKNAKKVAKAEEKQAKAAAKLAAEQEEANKQLGHYDKLNVITIEQEKEMEDYTPDLLEMPELEEVNLEDFQDAAGGIGDAFADMFEEVPVELSDWMQRLKEAIEAGDWEGVGKLIAEKLNEGMKYVDDWINDVLLPKGVEFAEIAARIGNGFVEGFDWTLLGKTIGDGINAIAQILDTFITTFKWDVLGQKLADFGNSLVNTIKWDLIAKTIADGMNGIATTVVNFYDRFSSYNFGSKIGHAIKEWFDKVEWTTIAQAFAGKWNELIDFIDGIVNTPGLWESIGNSIATFINKWFNTIKWNTLAETVSTGINGVFTALDTAITNIKFADMGKTISDSLHTMITGIDWKNIGKTIGDFFKGCLDFLVSIDWVQLKNDLFNALADLIAGVDWVGLAGRLGLLLLEFLSMAFDDMMTLVSSAGSTILTDLANFFESIGLDGVAGFFKGLSDALKDMPNWIKKNMIDPLIKTVKDLLGIHSPSTVFADFGKNIVEGLKQGIVNAWTALKTAIQTKIDNMKQQFSDAWDKIKEKAFSMWDTIKNGITTRLENLRANISTKIEAVKTLFNNAKTSIETILNNLKTSVSTIFTNMKTAVTNIFQQMWSGIKTIINSIIGGVEKMANGVISAINSMIDALNALSFEVPDWVPEIGGKTFGFDLPHVSTISIPRLAQGAVIPPNREFLAMLGDQKSGTNIEAPLDTMVEAFNKALDARGGTNKEPIVLQLDGEVIAQAVWDEEEKRYKQNTGYTPVYT